MNRLFKLIIGILLFLIVSILPAAQYNHSELKWFTFNTEHFSFLYHEEAKTSVNRFANVAETVFDEITKLYNYKPDERMFVIIGDYDDYANGGAYYYNNKILVWAKNLDFELRGTHNWFKNVFTHEFSHMIQLHTAKKAANFLPGIYLQSTFYEPDKRKDILTGYPNVLTSYSIPMNVIPAWFAEGVAQNQDHGKFNFDFWDANRDMNFRERLLSGNVFTYDKLADFGNKTSHEGETVYNTGMAFVDYMFNRFGRDITSKISLEMAKPFVYNFDTAILNATGVEAYQLFDEFIDFKKKHYAKNLKLILANEVIGKDISDSAFVNSHLSLSPDGSKLAFLSTKDAGEVTFYRRGLYFKDLKTDSIKMLAPYVGLSGLSWSSDGKFIYYGRVDTYSKYGNDYYDLYKWDIANEKEIRITEGLRAYNPAISSDGKTIAYVASHDGCQNLYFYDTVTKEYEAITSLKDGTQFYMPKWSPDGKSLVISRSNLDYGRSIVVFDRESKKISFEINTSYDYRNPSFSEDGKYIYYSSDETGIFNIYRYNLQNKNKELITNVRGGAFYAQEKNNALYYVNYTGITLRLTKLNKLVALDKKISRYNDYKIPKSYPVSKKNYVKNSTIYHQTYEHAFVMPRINFDNGKFKPGIYFNINDYLDKISLFGTFAMDTEGDYDLYALTEFKFLYPTIYASMINVKRHDNSSFIDSSKIVIGKTIKYKNNVPIPQFGENVIDYDYDITEYNIGAKTPVNVKPELFGYSLGNVSLDGYYGYATNKATAKYDDGTNINYTYFKDKSYHFKINLNTPKYGLDGDISPATGRDFYIKLSYHQSQFIKGFKVNDDYGTLQEDYDDYNYLHLDIDWREFYELTDDFHLATRVNLNWLYKNSIATFYNNYIGGLNGLRGYSFYSIGGTRSALASIYLRTPIIKRVDYRPSWLKFFSFKKLYAGVFTDFGTVFRSKYDKFWEIAENKRYYNLTDNVKNNLKTDVGLNLRLYGISFYNMPTTIEYSVAYGLNEFTAEDVTYGKEFRHYFTILFGFMDF